VFQPTHSHLLAVLLLVACGQIDDGGTGSATDNETGGMEAAGGSGSGSGPSATGGAHATDGDPTTGGDGSLDPSGPATSTGGLVGDLPEAWGPCFRDFGDLEPPCGESDLNGVLSGCGLWFDVPLAHIPVPTLGLNVVLMPMPAGDGVSGVGGTGGVPTEPHALEVFDIFPEEPPGQSGEVFDLLQPAGFIRAGNEDGEVPGYVTKAEGYGIAQVVLRQGDETLAVYRGLYSGVVDENCIR